MLVPKPWGARRLERFGRALPPGARIGESWEVADLPAAASSGLAEPVTRVAAGRFAGWTLQEVIAHDRAGLLGDAPDLDGRFPLLVKLLDVGEPLSVQVHPPAAYVAEHPEAVHKTETWVVLDAEPDAELMLGLAEGVTVADVRAAAGTPAVTRLLHRVAARPGAVHHVPAGTVHAAGAGVVLAEVQTPSDTTFRLYDWIEELGRAPRDLHLDQAVRALELAAPPPGPPAAPEGVHLPLATPHYHLDRRHLDADAEVAVPAGQLRIVQVLDGELAGDGLGGTLRAGGTVLLPAAWTGTLRSVGGCTWLETTLPARRGGTGDADADG